MRRLAFTLRSSARPEVNAGRRAICARSRNCRGFGKPRFARLVAFWALAKSKCFRSSINCWLAPADDIRRRIVQIIRRIRPETVITFDPEGGNQHPDHIAISRFGADGISAAADGRWYPEAGKPHVVGRLLWQSPLHVFDLGRMP